MTKAAAAGRCRPDADRHGFDCRAPALQRLSDMAFGNILHNTDIEFLALQRSADIGSAWQNRKPVLEPAPGAELTVAFRRRLVGDQLGHDDVALRPHGTCQTLDHRHRRHTAHGLQRQRMVGAARV